MLQADVSIDADLACRIYDSCKSVAIVGETTAMQSGLVSTAFCLSIISFVNYIDWCALSSFVVVVVGVDKNDLELSSLSTITRW